MKLLKRMMEVAPPGREPQVRALKKNPKIDNPFAVAWASYNDEANGQGSLSQNLRGKKKQSKTPPLTDIREHEEGCECEDCQSFWHKEDEPLNPLQHQSFTDTRPYNLIEALPSTNTPGQVQEGPKVKCVLITEGLGNRLDMNYYGPEAISSGPALFEGVPCFLDHQAESESQDRPERSVRDKCGYFKNVHTENVDGLLGLVAELHFDLSETGRLAYEKALTAIHYKQEMPDTESEYVGLSITADGDREPRTMTVENETLEVKYVTAFTRVGSVDQVTSPARGGRFLAALVESAAGALMKGKETRMKVIERLKAAQSALKEALTDKDIAEKNKKKLLESDAHLAKLLEEAMKAAEEAEEESGEEEEADAAPEPHGGVKPGHKVTKTVTIKHDGPTDDGDDGDGDSDGDSEGSKEEEEEEEESSESKRGYLKSLLKEADIPKKLWGLDKLMKLSLKEAKAEIEEKQALVESIREERELSETPVSFGAPLSESEEGDQGSLNHLFSGCSE